jgi:pilus assembly protein Flp/PilA
VKELRMSGAIAKVRRFLVSEDGPTAVEYAVMLALIVVACITVIGSLQKSVSGTFSSVSSSLAGASS